MKFAQSRSLCHLRLQRLFCHFSGRVPVHVLFHLTSLPLSTVHISLLAHDSKHTAQRNGALQNSPTSQRETLYHTECANANCRPVPPLYLKKGNGEDCLLLLMDTLTWELRYLNSQKSPQGGAYRVQMSVAASNSLGSNCCGTGSKWGGLTSREILLAVRGPSALHQVSINVLDY